MSAPLIQYMQERSFVPEKMPKARASAGMALRDAIAHANSLGCEIRWLGNGDISVWHYLLGSEKRPVGVSTTRPEVSRALYIALKRVEERVEKQIALRKQRAIIQEKTPPMLKGGTEPVALHVTPEPKSIYAPAPAQKEDALPPPPPTPSAPPPKSGVDGHAIVRFFTEVIQAVHYREHVTMDGTLTSFADCACGLCTEARRMIADIERLHDDVTTAYDLLDEHASRPAPQVPVQTPEPEPEPEPSPGKIGDAEILQQWLWHLRENTDEWSSRFLSAVGDCIQLIARGAAGREAAQQLRQAMLGEIPWDLMQETMTTLTGPYRVRALIGASKWTEVASALRRATRDYLAREVKVA